MAQLRIKMEGIGSVGERLRQRWERRSKAVRKAIQLTAEEVAETIVDEGRQDIQEAGNFGSRWTEGLTAEVTAGGGSTVVTVREAVPYWRVFQFGNVTHGKPLLWIPLSFALDAQGVRAKDFGQPLFRVDRKSGAAPLLMTGSGKKAVPKYFGKESVTIPKKFHLIEIARDVARRMRDMYQAHRDAANG